MGRQQRQKERVHNALLSERNEDYQLGAVDAHMA